MTSFYDDPSSDHYQNPENLNELLELAPDLPQFNEKLPFDNRPYIIPLYKPAGISSFDVIRKVRSKLIRHLGKGKGRRKLKIGHFGTLDPFAEGLLLVGTGKAMKLMSLIQEELPKHYKALGNIGTKTYSADCDGDIMSEVSVDRNELPQLYESIKEKSLELRGEYWQAPPYFSAVKHEGRALYEYAREGVFIDKPPVERFIYELELLANPTENPLEVSFRAKVSNGTYIRTLWQDMLSSIDGHGHLRKLIRDQIGKLNIDNALTPDDFIQKEDLLAFAPDQVIPLDRFEVDARQALDLLQGRVLFGCNLGDSACSFWAYYKNYLIGLVDFNGEAEIKMNTLLWAQTMLK